MFFLTIRFLFLFMYVILMDKFKITEYNPICKVLTEVYLIIRIPHSTVIIDFGQREKANL